jgi:hypothetical protein
MQPPIDDAKYRDYLNEVMMTFRFHPARAPSGEAVPAPSPWTFSCPASDFSFRPERRVNQLFRRKPIAELVPESDNLHGLRRAARAR